MYNIITKQDLFVLLSSCEAKQNEISIISKTKEVYGKEETERSKKALSKLGFFEDGILSNKGRMIAEALLSPDDLIITGSSALIDNTPVSYCYKHGFWTVLAPDIRTNLITLVSPVLNQDIDEFIRKNISIDLKTLPFEPVKIELTNGELLIFELLQVSIINKVKQKKSPLDKEESWLSPEDFLSMNSAFYLLSAADYITAEQRGELADLIGDEARVKKALAGLVKKNIIEMRGTLPDITFSQTSLSHKWLMADSLLDRFAIRNVRSGKSVTYNITKAGILRVSTDNKIVKYESVADIDLSLV